MADSKDKKKKKSNVNNNKKSANKKNTSKKNNNVKKKTNVSSKKTTTKKVTSKKKPTTKKKTTTKKPTTKKSVSTKSVSVKKGTKKPTSTKKTTPKKSVKVETKSVKAKKKPTVKEKPISTTSVKVSPEQIEVLTSVEEEAKKTVNYKTVRGRKKVKVTSNLEPVKKVSNSKKAKTDFKESEQEKSNKIIEEAFKEEEKAKEEIIAREVSEEEKPIILESFDIDNAKNSDLNIFLGRLISLILILILSVFLIMNFTVKYMTNSNNVDISYYESSDISYNLCSGENCSGELSETNTSIDKANVSLKYDAHFDEKTNYEVTYSIIYKYEVFDDTKTYYSNSTQVDSKKIKDKKDSVLIDVDTDINLAEYREKLKKFNEEKQKECSGSVSAILKVDGIEKSKSVATLYIPLGEGDVDKTIISSNMGDALFANGKHSRWGGTYVVMMIICFIVIVIACIGIIMLLNSNYDPLDDE